MSNMYLFGWADAKANIQHRIEARYRELMDIGDYSRAMDVTYLYESLFNRDLQEKSR